MTQQFTDQKKFQCARCKGEFLSLLDDIEQSYGCASSYVKRDGLWMVHCGYGSRYDLTSFSVAGQTYLKGIKKLQNKNICDECIEEGLHTGELVSAGNYM
jgi:hypothetical protein